MKPAFTGCSSRATYAIPMRMARFCLVGCMTAAALGMSGVGFAAVQRHLDQEEATRQRLESRLLPLREIERRVIPLMGGAEYLGFDFDADTGIYTLKFVRNGMVIWVDVDGRSGQIVRRTGR